MWVPPTMTVALVSVGGVVRRRDGRRRHAGERLGVAGVVGEAHLHLDRRAQVVGHQRVGARRRRGDVRLGAVGGHPDPLVRVAGGGQPVVIHDGGGDRRQRLPDRRRPGDRRRARRGVVGAGLDRAVDLDLARPVAAECENSRGIMGTSGKLFHAPARGGGGGRVGALNTVPTHNCLAPLDEDTVGGGSIERGARGRCVAASVTTIVAVVVSVATAVPSVTEPPATVTL